MDKRDAELIVRQAREGKQTSKIWEEDFPKYDYWDIYFAVYEAGEKSSVGAKRMITTRLKKLETAATKKERTSIVNEIDGLVCYLYDRYKESQKKLDEIRGIINR